MFYIVDRKYIEDLYLRCYIQGDIYISVYRSSFRVGRRNLFNCKGVGMQWSTGSFDKLFYRSRDVRKFLVMIIVVLCVGKV